MKSEKMKVALVNWNKKSIQFLNKICFSLIAFLFYQNTVLNKEPKCGELSTVIC